MTQTQTTSLIVAAEVWVPLKDGSGIELTQSVTADDTLAQNLPAIGDTLHGGVGLAGQSWAREVPLIINDLASLELDNTDALQTANVAAAAAVPTFDRGKVAAVLLLYLRGGQGVRAAVELWTGCQGQHELATAGAYYADLQRFGGVSPYVHFPMGSGLPGKVWQTARPQIMENLADSPFFLRSTGAENEGLTLGFGLPTINGLELRGVLLTLDSQNTTTASAYEIWEPAMTGQAAAMQCTNAAYPDAEKFGKAAERLRIQPGEGLIGKAWASRRPELTDDRTLIDKHRADAAAEDNLTFGLAIPVLVADEVRAVALLTW